MKKYMELPADYAVLSDDEMTYTTGGSAVGGIVTIVGGRSGIQLCLGHLAGQRLAER